MRLAYLAPDPVPAPKGAGTRIRRTVETLAELGHEVRLFTPASAEGETLTTVSHDTVELAGDNYLDRMLGFRGAARGWLDGLSERASSDVDAVIFRSIWDGGAAVGWRQRDDAGPRATRLVYEAHGFPSIELPSHYPGLDGAGGTLEKLIHEENRVLRSVDRVWTPSATGRRYLMSRGVVPHSIAVLPNTVEPDLFSPAPTPPAPSTPLRLVYLGTLAPWQGLETLLEALVPFRGGGQVELHVVGPLKSFWRRRLRALARRLRVHHALHLSDAMPRANLVSVLRTAHVCVAPLPADPRNAVMGCCPIKLLEYMAVGRPILTTAIPPVEEILEHDVSGWLVRPGSPVAMTDGIAWMLENPKRREELGLEARDRVLASWTPERFRERLRTAIELLR